MLDNQLVVAAGLVNAHAAVGKDLVTVFEPDRWPALPLAEKRRTNLGAVVFEAEIQVPRGRPGEVRNLAFNPDSGDALLKQGLRPAIELADRDCGLFGCRFR